MSTATLVVNLGSPDSPKTADVRRYLRQFLMDGNVIDLPTPLRALIVYAFILPFRPKKSGEAYATIWTDEGSPLIVYSKQFFDALSTQVPHPTALAMRYGNPSIPAGIKNLLKATNNQLDTLQLAPLYPHYAMSSTGTVIDEVREQLAKLSPSTELRILTPFYKESSYIEQLSKSIQPYLTQDYDHLLFSYHGIPERHLGKTDPTGCHCLKVDNCCETPSVAHKTCYRHHVVKTTEAVVNTLGLTDKWSISFQSRLGNDPWLTPNTEAVIEELAQNGAKNIVVVCPSFVADCLETLEEIAIRGQEVFEEHGGEKLTLIPCLNTNSDWINTVANWINASDNFVTESTLKGV